MATSGSAKIITKKSWTKVIGTIQRQKATTPSMPKVKAEKKRVIFRQKALSSQKSEADLMMALNKLLRKAWIISEYPIL